MTEEKPPYETAVSLLNEFGIDHYEFFMLGATEAEYVTVYRDEEGRTESVTLEYDGIPYGTWLRRVAKPWPDGFPFQAFWRLLQEAGLTPASEEAPAPEEDEEEAA